MPDRMTPPLYPSEREIARLVLGPERAGEWPDKAVILEREGLPKVSPFMGGRYLPKVLKFFEVREGLDAATPSAPKSPVRIVLAEDGEETPHAEKEAALRHRRTDRRMRLPRAQGFQR
jgi:hypothetical protein